jgi:hypothetical protein
MNLTAINPTSPNQALQRTGSAPAPPVAELLPLGAFEHVT